MWCRRCNGRHDHVEQKDLWRDEVLPLGTHTSGATNHEMDQELRRKDWSNVRSSRLCPPGRIERAVGTTRAHRRAASTQNVCSGQLCPSVVRRCQCFASSEAAGTDK